MKKRGILHAELMKEIAALGHGDQFLIADAGMPIPEGVKLIDLAFVENHVDFNTVLEAVLAEVEVETFLYAKESQTNERIFGLMMDQLENCSNQILSHEELKTVSKKCKFAIRTGEFSPYANVILKAGVVF